MLAGAPDVARQVITEGHRFARFCRPALVNGAPGIVAIAPNGPIAVAGLTITGGRIVAIDLVLDPAKLPEHVPGS